MKRGIDPTHKSTPSRDIIACMKAIRSTSQRECSRYFLFKWTTIASKQIVHRNIANDVSRCVEERKKREEKNFARVFDKFTYICDNVTILFTCRNNLDINL